MKLGLFIVLLLIVSCVDSFNTFRLNKSPLIRPFSNPQVLKYTSGRIEKKFTLNAAVLSPQVIEKGIIQSQHLPLKGIFNKWLVTLLVSTGVVKYAESLSTKKHSSNTSTSQNIDSKCLHEWKEIENKYLRVFWLLRFTEWLQGPYFHTIFSLKTNPFPTLLKDLPSFLTITTTLSSGLLGPFITRIIDRRNGGRLGGLLYTILATFAGLSVCLDNFYILFLGRVIAGISTPLQKVSPEAWICEQHNDFLQNKAKSPSSSEESQQESGVMKKDCSPINMDSISLTKSFTQAYSGDSLVAVLAGILSSLLTARYGLHFPFFISPFLLFLSGYYVLNAWRAPPIDSPLDISQDEQSEKKSLLTTIFNEIKLSFLHIKTAFGIIAKTPEIQLYGLLQVFFDTSLYLFILKWSSLLTHYGYLIGYSKKTFPYGNFFSCLMCSCFFGTNFFSYFFSKQLDKTSDESTNKDKKTTEGSPKSRSIKSINKFSIHLLSSYLLLFSLAMHLTKKLSPAFLPYSVPQAFDILSPDYLSSLKTLKLLSLTFISMEFLIGNILPLLAYFRNYSLRNYPYYRSILSSLFTLPSAFLIFYFNSSPNHPHPTFTTGRNILLLTSSLSLLYYKFLNYV